MKKTIVVAAGGGNDAFTALAYGRTLGSEFILVTVLGLTPFHTLSEVPLDSEYLLVEEPIILASSSLTRYITTDAPQPKKVYCNEALLPHGTICLSPKYPAAVVATKLREALASAAYTPANSVIHLVDFGGDILTDGKQPSIISPELDAFSLAVTDELKEYTRSIRVYFPGVDGELPVDYMRSYCTQPLPMPFTLVGIEEVYNLVKTRRAGNTLPNIIRYLTHTPEYTISKHWTHDGRKYRWSTNPSLDEKLLANGWEIDRERIKNPFVEYFAKNGNSLVDLLVITRAIYNDQDTTGPQLSDLYCNWLRADSNGDYNSRVLTPNQPVCYIGMGSTFIAERWI